VKWITRTNVKVDRVACPWLIRRFLDPHAEFVFVEEARLLEQPARMGPIPFDAPRLHGVRLNHRGKRCTFEALLEDYRLSCSGLARLAMIVRALDVKGQKSVAAEGPGLRAIAEGFAALGLTDEQRLLTQFSIYDALYEYCRTRIRELPISISWHGLS